MQRHVVVPHRATWDREWAAETRQTLEDTVIMEGKAATEAANAARRYRTAGAMCLDFVRRWDQVPRGDLENAAADAASKVHIEMQHRLAAHTGVQLVCATGLHDPAVDTAFTGTGSVIIKLRNDGDMRRNLSFLRLRAVVVDGIDIIESITAGRPAGAPQNWVDATRYEIR